LYPERLGELLNDRHGWIPGPAFDVADIGAVDAGAVGIVFLAPAFLEPELSNIGTKALAYIHAL